MENIEVSIELRQYFYSRIKIGGLIYKSITLYHMMTKLHKISAKVIPIHTFVNALTKVCLCIPFIEIEYNLVIMYINPPILILE